MSEDLKRKFCAVYNTFIKRNGADELLGWLETTDFFEAPASSKYHLSVPGGLCEHSLNVYRRLCGFLNAEYAGTVCPYSDETIALVALCHDLCKVNFYKAGWKNQKCYDLDKVESAPAKEVKHDAAGDFIWEVVPTYEIDEDLVFGHGEKSVYLIMKFTWLTDEEAQAIRYHMGAFQDGEARDYGNACEKNPLVFFLHMADSAASFIDEA